MDALRSSPYKSGYWAWDDFNNELMFINRESSFPMKSNMAINMNAPLKQAPKQLSHEMIFRETVDALEQVRFRRYHQRRCKPNEPEVITVQDIKDVALFIADIRDVTPEFIKFFHIPTMDRFLRALIVYFQYYIQVWEYLVAKREERKTKLHQPVVDEIESKVRDSLSDLRAMAAREYCSMLIGSRDARKFHHHQNNVSLSGKDKRLYETLICMSVRVVWIALQRKYLSLIELEMNRLLRTDIFNLIVHRGIRGGADLSRTANEARVLTGLANTEESKLLHKSPMTKELVIGDHDYRMLIIGERQFEPTDEWIEFLEIAYAAPEEKLMKYGVPVGLLGVPRNYYDAMLMNLEKFAKQKLSRSRLVFDFRLPPKIFHRDEAMPKAFPQAPSKFHETQQKLRSRKAQCKMWLRTLEKSSEGREMSILDLSVTQSHVLLLTSRSSVSTAAKHESADQ